MAPFDYVPRMAVVHLIITAVFYVNSFVWIYGLSKILPPITIVEGIFLDYNLHFKVIFGEFVQTYEGTDNTMSPRTADTIALGPAMNMQGRIRCFSLVSGRVLQRVWKDVIIYKMLVNAIKRINYMGKKQKAIKGL